MTDPALLTFWMIFGWIGSWYISVVLLNFVFKENITFNHILILSIVAPFAVLLLALWAMIVQFRKIYEDD